MTQLTGLTSWKFSSDNSNLINQDRYGLYTLENLKNYYPSAVVLKCFLLTFRSHKVTSYILRKGMLWYSISYERGCCDIPSHNDNSDKQLYQAVPLSPTLCLFLVLATPVQGSPTTTTYPNCLVVMSNPIWMFCLQLSFEPLSPANLTTYDTLITLLL